MAVETGAGEGSFHSDDEYKKAGATDLYGAAEVILKVHQPEDGIEAELIREGSSIIGFLSPMTKGGMIKFFAGRRITSFAMELVPRITRAQGMDALSSMASIAGYKAVLIAANYQKVFPSSDDCSGHDNTLPGLISILKE